MSYFTDLPLPNEAEAIETLKELVLASQAKKWKRGEARRFAHPKSHGLVNATFFVPDNLPEKLKVGLFAKTGKYEAKIRFSLGAGGPDSPDFLPNVHGAALKVLNVPGKKLLPGEEDSTEHDFLMANDSVFFCRTIDEMILLGQRDFKGILRHHPGLPLRVAEAVLKVLKSPLTTSYFSQVPYRFGDYAAKYALIPIGNSSPFFGPGDPLFVPPINPFDRDYLRHSIEKTLNTNPGTARFAFCVQLRNNGTLVDGGEPIADPTVRWRGRLHAVALVTVQPLNGGTIKESDGEALSFNPWRALAEHEPLSWVGRARRIIYPADFAWRQAMNAAEKQ